MKIAVMTFGSRGDVQPFLSLAIALQQRGHTVTLAAPDDMEDHFRARNIPYRLVPMNADTMNAAQSATEKGWSPGMLVTLFREVLPRLKRDMVAGAEVFAEIAEGADLLISHGFLMPFAWSIHQRTGVPLMLGIAAPIIPTKEFSTLVGSVPFAKEFIYPRSHGLLVRMVTSFMIDPMNTYRKRVGLPKASGGEMIRALFSGKFSVANHYSRHLMPRPADWGDHVHVTGQWVMPPDDSWTPPDDLRDFLAQGEAPVYVGFGSTPIKQREKVTQIISEALQAAGLRGIFQPGMGGLNHSAEHVMTIGDTPHHWLFPQMAAIVHHGGSGTTHDALRAGKPALIAPFAADQPFWARTLHARGVTVPSMRRNKFTVENLTSAFRTLTQDADLRQRAADLGALLREEDGIGTTVALAEQIAG
jgi:sterol 3beta-glucosyltransferase